MKKHLLAVGAATTLGLAGIAGIGIASATSNTTGTDPMSNLVSAIATKFNLKQSDVQAVFDEQHTQMEQQRETEVKDKLAQLVKDGKLTQAQSDAITAKRAEIKKEMDANRTNGTKPTKADMDAKKTALEAWAKQQGIDTQYLHLVMGGPGGHRGGSDGDKQPADNSSSSSTSNTTTQ